MMTIKTLAQHIYPDVSVDVYSEDDCRFLLETTAAKIRTTEDDFYNSKVLNWVVYGGYVRMWV